TEAPLWSATVPEIVPWPVWPYPIAHPSHTKNANRVICLHHCEHPPRLRSDSIGPLLKKLSSLSHHIARLPNPHSLSRSFPSLDHWLDGRFRRLALAGALIRSVLWAFRNERMPSSTTCFFLADASLLPIASRWSSIASPAKRSLPAAIAF